MAINAKTRQRNKVKKQKKRNAKLKNKQKHHAKQLQKQHDYHPLSSMIDLNNAEIVESSVSANLFDAGIGVATLSRRLSDNRIAYAYFLVDVHCLGIKDCYGYIGHPSAYKAHYHALNLNSQHTSQITQTPAYICKLVYSAEAYARNIGLSPASEYTHARHIFMGIDPNTCIENFTFGESGKPLYVAGPHDSRWKIRRIFHTLKQNLGDEGFDYILPLEAMDEIMDEFEDFTEEDEAKENSINA